MSKERINILKGAKRILVKIGSGVLTGHDGLDLDIIGHLVDEVSEYSRKGFHFVIVSSGAIASGMNRMGFKGNLHNLPQKQAAAAIGQGRLMRVYANAFGRHKLVTAQILLTMSDLTNRQRFLNIRNTLSTLVEWGVIPIINENDTVSVDEIKFGDNDTLASIMANITDANLLINLTNTEGLYDRDPRGAKKSRLISLVTEITAEIEAAASSEPDTVGMGGMKSKVIAAGKVTASGIPCIIAHGKKAGILSDIFSGKETGTLFLPTTQHLKSKKSWIAFTLRSMGKICIDRGAENAIVNQGRSLLPSGIVRIDGDFHMGDPVTCVNEDGVSIAKGLVNYSSSDIERIKGLQTTRIKQVLGDKTYDEIIHRDNMAVSR
ncbi:MAG: glutamate 5-kinase [Thermodesulfobacteriota bacterium]|nr:glutamate 5-kinase [Thermodesulfobacteriota bacterium]